MNKTISALFFLTITFSMFSFAGPQAKSNLHDYRKGSVVLMLKDSATAQEREALETVFQNFNLRVEKKLLQGKAMRLRIGHPAFKDQEDFIIEEIEATGAVRFVELDHAVHPAQIPNDPYYSSQWHHSKLESESAWRYTKGSQSVIVAVCDAGFDVNHPDLAANLLLPGYNTVTNNSNLTSHFHGTETAGVIGAVGNNALGVAGMAWTIKMIPIQISNQANGVSTNSDVAECISYAADRGAKIVSISYDSIYTNTITDQAAQYMRSKGGIVIVAAGNYATDISQWGPSPNMLVVGATNSNDQLASFSNYGTPVDLVAPGQDIFVPTLGNTYKAVNGTSYATPVVSGTAALIYSLKPSWTPTEVDNFLLSTTLDLGTTGTDLYYAKGRLQTGLAVRKAAIAADTVAPTVSISTPMSGATVSGVFQASSSAQDNIGIASVQYFIDGVSFGTVTASPYTLNMSTAKITNGTHTLTATAKDLNGNSASTSISINVKNNLLITLDNLPMGQTDSSRTFTGKWCQSATAGYYGNASLFSCGSATVDTYRFTPSITVTKSYKVYLRYTSGSSRTSSAKVVIKYSGATATKYVNMQTGGGTWLLLGTYKLDMGRTNYLQVSDSNGMVTVDGARFEAVP